MGSAARPSPGDAGAAPRCAWSGAAHLAGIRNRRGRGTERMSLPTMLYADRLVSAHPVLAAFCEDFVARVTGRSRAPVDVPHLPGVSGIGFARWLYRQWLAGGRRWGPLVHLDPARCPPDAAVLADSAGQAAGGWLFVSEGWEGLPLVVPPDVRLLRQGSAVLDLPEAVGERIRWLDRFHLVTADPSLESVRRTLLAHCRALGARRARRSAARGGALGGGPPAGPRGLAAGGWCPPARRRHRRLAPGSAHRRHAWALDVPLSHPRAGRGRDAGRDDGRVRGLGESRRPHLGVGTPAAIRGAAAERAAWAWR